jgi:ADP-ribose pyrophosphatase YjhB (NUDIX family)
MANYPETGGPIVQKIPDGDTQPRLVCETCGFIHYDNPKIVIGAVATWQDRILLCRRSIEPQRGHWTIPAGFLELNETAEQGAARETREEARAEIAIECLLAVYNIPRISQVQLIYRARLLSEAVAPGVESLETRLFDYGEIPWDDLAFPSVVWALRHHDEARDRAAFAPFTNPSGDRGDYRPGTPVGR